MLLLTSAVIGQQREHVCLPVRAVIKLHTWITLPCDLCSAQHVRGVGAALEVCVG
jgi:hypothetical protein